MPARRYVGSEGGHKYRGAEIASGYNTATVPAELPPGKVWCVECRQLVGTRKDGSIRNHRTRSRICCIGSPG